MTASLAKSVKRTDHEQSENANLIRPIVPFDGGNRSIQWVDSYGKIHVIPSFIKPIDPTWEDVQPDDRSVVIEQDGETFVVGQAAKDLAGTAVFTKDKIQLAKKLVLAALEPNPGNEAVRVERLLIALPNSRKEEHIAELKAIEGTHEFVRNNRPIIATVRKVEAIDETLAAYKFAVQQGLFLSKKNPNGVMDLGGGTSILRLYTTSGSLIRGADQLLPGTDDLACKISARITRDLVGSPDLSLIMDGIEDKTFDLGTTGYNFREAFEICREQWLTEIRGHIKSRWSQWLPNLGEVLIIGGSAPLAQPLQEATKGRFKIAPNPQTISIVGMLGL